MGSLKNGKFWFLWREPHPKREIKGKPSLIKPKLNPRALWKGKGPGIKELP